MNPLRKRPITFRLRMHARAATAVGIGAVLMLCGCAAPPVPPTANASLPADLRANRNEVLQEVMTATGDETWLCRRVHSPGNHADSTQLLWTELGSEATLVDSGRHSIGTVVPGPHFLAYDGSYVIGEPRGENQVSANTLTWVRYKAKFVATPRPGEGRFANVSSIQRIDTKGGLPPQPACTVEGLHLLVPYAATYMIYREKGRAALAQTSDPASTAAAANLP